MNTDLLAEAVTLIALAFVGVNLVRVERQLARNKKSRQEADELAEVAVADARREFLGVLADARLENERLSELVRRAEAVTASASTLRASLTVETSRTAGVMDELNAACASADRTCSRLSGVISEAVTVHQSIKPDNRDLVEEDIRAGDVEAAVANGENVVRMTRAKS